MTMEYMISCLLWSILGLAIGYLAGRIHCKWKDRNAHQCEG